MPAPLSPAMRALLQAYAQGTLPPHPRRELWLEAIERSWLTSTRGADGTLRYTLTVTGRRVLDHGWY